MTTINNAIAAYSAMGKTPGVGEAAGAVGETPEGVDFASMLKDVAKSAIGEARKAEDLSKQAITGKADIREVVAAVASAELTLETVVAVRDKVISAYKEILSMPI
ncbi:MAG: flagellar hook-basal body complex protein FliE [Alphaproteobacteria bacterium]|nr:flagellar hook-basal body complex protein FliE [Alphaproteobacteria bacterium]